MNQRLLLSTVGASLVLSGCGLLFGDSLDVSVARPGDADAGGAAATDAGGVDPGDGGAPPPVPPEDGKCAEDRKLCEDACVSLVDPAHGCGGSGCAACTAPEHGTSRCSGGCDFVCAAGFEPAGAFCVTEGPHDVWQALPDMPTVRTRVAAAALADGRVLALGGLYYNAGTTSYVYLSTVEAYTPSTKTWTKLAGMPTARSNLGAATSGGRVFALGGYWTNGLGSETFYDVVEAYTPGTNTWAKVASLGTARSALAAAALPDGRIFALGGQGASGYLAAAEVYTPATSTWTPIANMPTKRARLAAAAGVDGRIYAIGGVTSGEVLLGTVEVYTPSTGKWTAAASLPTPRRGLVAAAGLDGRIYAIGGEAASGMVSTVEVYTPATNTWATAGGMSVARMYMGAARGPDGRIYVVGGETGGSAFGYKNDADVYTP